jgi:hypothetical protein
MKKSTIKDKAIPTSKVKPKKSKPKKPSKLNLALKTLVSEIKKDPSYKYMWQANIAMAFKDNYSQYKKFSGKKSMSNEDIHKIANNAATYFIMLCCDEIKYPEGR